jgi:hypothetical protein
MTSRTEVGGPPSTYRASSTPPNRIHWLRLGIDTMVGSPAGGLDDLERAHREEQARG